MEYKIQKKYHQKSYSEDSDILAKPWITGIPLGNLFYSPDSFPLVSELKFQSLLYSEASEDPEDRHANYSLIF